VNTTKLTKLRANTTKLNPIKRNPTALPSTKNTTLPSQRRQNTLAVVRRKGKRSNPQPLPGRPTNEESAHKSLGIWERRKLTVML
jgi:hypothetical protein